MDFHKWLSWMFDTYIMSKRSKIAITIWALYYCMELATLTSSAFHSNQSTSIKKAYSGLIIRDAYGQILGACSRLTSSVSSVFAAEAVAYIGLSENRDIHAMAHDGLLRGEDLFWVEESPDPIIVVAAEEHRLVKPP
ncbi:hypothetical protein CXB51_019540 [Gossypium anomalum]|uniref:RNase H type-1 domain-containing protein n=1 Tax=Gossypium anomalum TaxID=47600 RepID=A0A8J5ZDQ3_9ROSI|nr:hypothetical protein CXB51_019540 [Gossypium anomalum]